MFKGLMQLNYNALIFTHFYAMSVYIMTRLTPYLVMVTEYNQFFKRLCGGKIILTCFARIRVCCLKLICSVYFVAMIYQ